MTASATWTPSDLDALRNWIARQRWFGDKSREIVSVEPETLAIVQVDGHQVIFHDVTTRFGEGEPSRYLVPLRRTPGGGFGDAFELPAFLAWLGNGFRSGRVVSSTLGEGAEITWSVAGESGDWSNKPPKVLDGEQSNTSVMFGQDAILKVFRRLQPGVNPDSEIVAFLTAEGSFTHAPAFLGAIRLEDPAGPESIELAAVQRFVPNQGDCWRWLPAAVATGDVEDRRALLDSVRLLGQRTGELHVALGQGEGPDFRPEPFSRDDVETLESRLGSEMRHTASMLHRVGATSYLESEDLASALLRDVSNAEVLVGLPRTRVHGDYHLGQVLRSGNDFVIIDFEGEPSRSLAERRARSSPLKDVAGMLRSLDYATASAGGHAGDAAVRAWGVAAEEAFIEGYAAAVAASAIPLVPADPHQFRRALDLFMIEKTLYEVRYELDNRPDWVDIPLGGLRRIAAST